MRSLGLVSGGLDLGSLGNYDVVKDALGILRSYGANAHLYLPGVGNINGIAAGNYLDSAGVTAASVDNPVGLAVDSFGAINATQATTANKPILRRGLLNQLLNNNDFSTFSKFMVNLTTGVADPFGGSTATTLTAAEVNSEVWKFTTGVAGNYTSALWIRRKTGSGQVSIRNGANSAWLPITLTSNYQLFVNDGGAVTKAQVDVLIATSGDEIDVCRAGLFQGTYTAQQIIDAGGIPLTTSVAASNSNSGKYSWQFDGVNDSLLTGNLGITNTVSVVIAGVLNSLPATTVFANEGVNGLQILIRNTGVIDVFKAGVEPIISTASGTIVAGVPFVLTFRLQGGVSVLRKNGAQVSTAAYVASLSATAGLSISEAGASIDGSIYPIIAIKGTVSDADLLTLERFVGQLSGVLI